MTGPRIRPLTPADLVPVRAPGRPPLPEAQRLDYVVKLRLTQAEAAQVMAQGGAPWVRALVRDALAMPPA